QRPTRLRFRPRGQRTGRTACCSPKAPQPANEKGSHQRATSGSREDLAVAEVRGTLPTNPVALYSMNRMSYPCVRCLAWHRARGAPVPHKRHWGTPGSWYTFPGGGFVRIVITLLPAILMVVSFSVPIHAINTLDVVQF